THPGGAGTGLDHRVGVFCLCYESRLHPHGDQDRFRRRRGAYAGLQMGQYRARQHQVRLTGTYRSISSKHVPRYLAEYQYRFNRRYDLAAMIPRLTWAGVRTVPMPYTMLKLAEDGG